MPHSPTPRVRLNLEVVEDRSVPATLVGTLWCDTDSNGIQDVGEAAVEGVVVTLTLPDATTTTATTDAAGNYSFSALDPGSYTIQFESPAGFTSTSAIPVEISSGDASVGQGLIPTGGTSGSGSTSRSGGGSRTITDLLDTLDAYPVYVAAVQSATGQFTASASSAHSQ